MTPSSDIAALFVAKDGCYFGLPGVDPWDEDRDARFYPGPHPVVAHPPCQLWGKFAKVNYVRWGGEHNRPGNDQGKFAAALAAVRHFGGVLEHPAFSNAWGEYGLLRPVPFAWSLAGENEWVCEVWQSAYGHLARKRTWLLWGGPGVPPALCWGRPAAACQIGFHDQRGKERNKPTISGKAASATPIQFRDELIKLARMATQ